MPRPAVTALVSRHPYPATPADFRRRPGLDEARRLAAAFNEGAYQTARRIYERLLPFRLQHGAALRDLPSYTEIRDFLRGDHECDDRIAQTVALDLSARNARSQRLAE